MPRHFRPEAVHIFLRHIMLRFAIEEQTPHHFTEQCRTCRIRCHITNLEQPVQVPVLRDIIQTGSNDLLRFPARNIRAAKQDTPAKHLVHAEYRCCHFCTPRAYNARNAQNFAGIYLQ